MPFAEGADVDLLTAALDGLAAAVTVHDARGRILYVNEAAVDMMGFPSAEAMLTMTPGSWVSDFEVVHADGRPVAPDDLPGRRVLAGRPAEPLLVRSVSRHTRDARWVRIQARGVTDAGGRVVAATNVMEDVTAVKDAEIAQALLARASETLARSLDHEETLQRVAELAVPDLADWCGVDLLDDRGRIRPVAVAHVDPERAALGRELRRRYPTDPDAPAGLAQVVRTGATELVQDIPEAALAAVARDDEHLRLLRAVGFRSVLLVPLRSGGRITGALSLVLAEQTRRFSPGDVTLAEELARRAAVAIEQSRLYTERTAVARALQAGLLPERLVAPPGWEVAVLYRPAGGAQDVGGDFYDLVDAGAGHLALVGDVTGKGARAAALTARARHTLVAATAASGDPARALAQLNRTLRDLDEIRPCTVASVLIGADGGVVVHSAGHPPPLLVRGRTVTSVGEPGPLLGFLADGAWPAQALATAPGDVLVLYTDGVTDAVVGGTPFGETGLHAALRAAAGGTAAATADGLAGALDAAGGERRDDVAVLVLRRLA